MRATSSPHRPTPPTALEGRPEVSASLWLAASVLVVLSVAKSVASWPYVGPACLTFAAFWQLRAPLWRAERQGLGLDALGCHLGAWRLDVRLALGLALVVLPLYAAAYHCCVTQGLHLLQQWHLWPHADPAEWHLAWRLPQSGRALCEAGMWFAERALTHTFGVALPEELFYRGYLQPLWQMHWPTQTRVWGASFGAASVCACAVFALGHFVGEWHLGRLGPFFPSLLFAWQRARSGTIVGAVGLHALCNLFAEVWVRQYAPGHTGP